MRPIDLGGPVPGVEDESEEELVNGIGARVERLAELQGKPVMVVAVANPGEPSISNVVVGDTPSQATALEQLAEHIAQTQEALAAFYGAGGNDRGHGRRPRRHR